jgi:hypothetical protein
LASSKKEMERITKKIKESVRQENTDERIRVHREWREGGDNES